MARTDKSTRILSLLHRLERGAVVSKSSFSIENNITERSFDRDIQSIRIFLSETYSANEVIYDHELLGYRLTERIHSELSAIEAILAIKSLIQSHTLRVDELAGIADSILSMTPQSEQKTIKRVIQEEILTYTSPTHGKALLKMILDLFTVIAHNEKIILHYNTVFGIEVLVVIPCAVELGVRSYYLVAWCEDKLMPFLFRLEYIDSFLLTKKKSTMDPMDKQALNRIVSMVRENDDQEFQKFIYQGGAEHASD